MITDKGYESEHIREVAQHRKMIPIISRKSNSKKTNLELDTTIFTVTSLINPDRN